MAAIPEFSYLLDVLIILAAAILFVLLMRYFRTSAIIGYLLAGIIIGPSGVLLVKNQGTIHLLAEFGVVFLLFSIGLELSFQRLLSMRWHIFGLGLAQVLVTSAVIGTGVYFVGLPPAVALVVGGALALSSTATVLQLLRERNELAAKFSRVVIAILIFQDLAVVPLLVLIPKLAVVQGAEVFTALAFAGMKAVAALLLIVLLGRLVVGALLKRIPSDNPEVFTATLLLLVLGAGLLTAVFGVSMALGAFLAGVLLAETKYRHQVEADIQPFRGLFLGLFFMSVGMSVNIPLILDHAGTVTGLALGLIAVKALLLLGLCVAFRQPLASGVRVALLLAQFSEFGFVIFTLAVQQGIVPPLVGQVLISAIIFSMVLTPLLASLGKAIAGAVERKLHTQPRAISKEVEDVAGHVIIAGFGRTGKIIGKLLSLYHIPYVALEKDSSIIHESHTKHLPVFFGDTQKMDTLKAAGIARAKAIAVTLNNPKDTEDLVASLHTHYPEVKILARAHDTAHQQRLQALGAQVVIPEILEPSLLLSAALLEALGLPSDETERLVAKCRQDNYAFLGNVAPGQ